MGEFRSPRGLPDFLPPRSELHQRIIRTAENLCRTYGYRRIETPVFEHTEVVERGLEETSEIVAKEMYRFRDRGGRSMTLRPEGTAPVIRAVLEHSLHRSGIPVKLYYTAPMFRYERPQAGRYRQHTQVGAEAVGSEAPEVDAEVIHLAVSLFRRVRLEGVGLMLNSIGHPECRAAYLPKLEEFLEARSEELCADCRRRMVTNPLRTFDCKVPRDREIMREAPLMIDHLCAECAAHFDRVRELLSTVGVEFDVDPTLVRGLDYYTRTAFEFVAPGLGAQNSVGGGGRYDGLAEQMGGERLPGIGFGLGVERIADALEQGARAPHRDGGLDVYVVSVGEEARRRALTIATRLREAGLATDLDSERRGVKGQFRAADRLGARHTVILGEKEIAESAVTVKDMGTGEEARVSEDELVSHLRGGAAEGDES